jgi:hypothetical protein
MITWYGMNDFTGLATAFEILASVLVQAAGLAEEKGYPSRYEVIHVLSTRRYSLY